jgi:negative regulator of flagellin synthesis FlgM
MHVRNPGWLAPWQVTGFRSYEMKIGSYDNKPITPAGSSSVSSAAAGKAKGNQGPEPSAQVALSPVASVMVNETNADFDTEKVARIAQAIRDGKFKVNADAIANKLIETTTEMLGGASH